MSGNDPDGLATPEDTENSENFVPSQKADKSFEQIDCRLLQAERHALSSIQLNLEDHGNETLKTSNSVDVPQKDLVCDIAQSINEEDTASNNCNLRSEEEDNPVSSEGRSTVNTVSTEGTWESCTGQLEPASSLHVPPHNECSEKYDTAEDISEYSLEELSSSKEVSFNLPANYSDASSFSDHCLPSTPPISNSVQSLNQIVTTVLENNPDICQLNCSGHLGNSGSNDATDKSTVCPPVSSNSLASQILHQTSAVQDGGLSDSFSELIGQFSGLKIEPAERSGFPSSNIVCPPPVGSSYQSYRESADISVCSDTSKFGIAELNNSVTECDSFSEGEVLPGVNASDELPTQPLPSTLLPASLDQQEPLTLIPAEDNDKQEPLTLISAEDNVNHEQAPALKSSSGSSVLPEDTPAAVEVETECETQTPDVAVDGSSADNNNCFDSCTPIKTEPSSDITSDALDSGICESSPSSPNETTDVSASQPAQSFSESTYESEQHSEQSLPLADVGEAKQCPNPLLVKESLDELQSGENCTDTVVDPVNLDPVVTVVDSVIVQDQSTNRDSAEPSVVEAQYLDLNSKVTEPPKLNLSQEDQPLPVSEQVQERSENSPLKKEDATSDIPNEVFASNVPADCSPTSSDLNITNDFFLDSTVCAGDIPKQHREPLSSLLDTTLPVDVSPSHLSSDIADQTTVTVVAPFPDTQTLPAVSPEQVVLEKVPAKALDLLTTHTSCTALTSDTREENTSTIIAKESAQRDTFEDPKEPSANPCVNSFLDFPEIDTSELEELLKQEYKFDAMPMNMMDAHMDHHQWHPNDQVNSVPLGGGDNNCHMDVNVNPCDNMQDNFHHNDMRSQINSHTMVDSFNSSTKRKNEEDSAFEDLATDANSDLVDDHIMDDHVEEIGVAAVSRRSPSQTRTERARESQPRNTGDLEQPAVNHSEAGPEVAEFTEEEFRTAAEVFKDPSTFEFLERVSNTKAFEESSLSRLSLYVKFDPLVSKKSQEIRRQSTFKKPVAPQKKGIPVAQEAPTADEELILTSYSTGSPVPPRKELDANKLIDFQSPTPPTPVGKANPKMVPVEPLQRIENMQQCKVFTEDDMKKAIQINDLLFQERLIKKDKDIAELERKMQAQAGTAKEERSILEDTIHFTRKMLEQSGEVMRQWQEKKELERVEVTRERDQALEDLRSVEASFSELHRRYEKIKAVLEGYKQNEEGLRVQMLDTQDKLKNQEQMYEALKVMTQEKLDSANAEIENAKKSGGSEIAVLRSQLMKAEMKISSLERNLEQKAQEFAQLTDIYDDLVARVSGGGQ